jgi:predicted nucleotidyltransferase
MYRVDWKLLESIWEAMPNVAAAWAFGSSQGGVVHDGGDIDIGVLFDRQPSLDDLAELRAQIQSATHFDEIDLVPLNDASAILRFEAISGRRIFCRDRVECAGYVSLWAREYEDDMAMIEMAVRRKR